MVLTGTSKPRFLEIGAALFLCAIYFWLVKYYAVGITNNTTNGEIFTCCSTTHFELNQLFDVWKGRLSGLLITGWLFDLLVNNSAGDFGQYCIVFGLYQAGWLFLLMLVVIFSLRHALLINAGIFLGVMYNFFPICGLYFYPWDIPATLFFTLAALFYQQRKPYWMLAAVCAGCLFKETVLVCALLVLLVTEWTWWRRAVVFAAVAAFYLLGKKFLMEPIHVVAAALSMNDSKNLGDVVKPRVLLENLHTMLSVNGLYVVFANAGTMTAVLLFGWQRRFLPFMVLIVAFLAGQAMYGAFLEFRIFMQILPLSLIILSERFLPAPVAKAPRRTSKKNASDIQPAPAWVGRDSSRFLPPFAAGLIGLSSLVIVWQYVTLLQEKPTIVRGNVPAQGAAGLERLMRMTAWFKNGVTRLGQQLAKGDLPDREKEHVTVAWSWFIQGSHDEENKLAVTYQSLGLDAEAAPHYRTTLLLSHFIGTNSITANNYAWLLATSYDPAVRNGDEAVSLAEMACETTGYHDVSTMGTLAAACAEDGHFDEAVEVQQRVIALARLGGPAAVLEKNEKLLELYQSGRAYHEEPKSGRSP